MSQLSSLVRTFSTRPRVTSCSVPLFRSLGMVHPKSIRTFSSTIHSLNKASPTTTTTTTTSSLLNPPNIIAEYSGPLSKTFHRLKLFSVSSLIFATGLTPILLLSAGDLSLFARISLATTALTTSGLSTALISWIGNPYVNTMKLDSSNVLYLNTLNWKLESIITVVKVASMLRTSSRPFASWEIPTLIAEQENNVMKNSSSSSSQLVAESFIISKKSNIPKSLGKWSIEMKTCSDSSSSTKKIMTVQGKPVRYFNVHEELLDDRWRVVG